MIDHDTAMQHVLCKLADGSIVALPPDHNSLTPVIAPGAVNPEWLNMLRASDHMYRQIDSTAAVLSDMVEVLESVGGDQLVAPMSTVIASLRTAQAIALEGIEAVSQRMTPPKPPEPPKRKKWWFGEK